MHKYLKYNFVGLKGAQDLNFVIHKCKISTFPHISHHKCMNVKMRPLTLQSSFSVWISLRSVFNRLAGFGSSCCIMPRLCCSGLTLSNYFCRQLNPLQALFPPYIPFILNITMINISQVVMLILTFTSTHCFIPAFKA